MRLTITNIYFFYPEPSDNKNKTKNKRTKKKKAVTATDSNHNKQIILEPAQSQTNYKRNRKKKTESSTNCILSKNRDMINSAIEEHGREPARDYLAALIEAATIHKATRACESNHAH